MRRTLVAFFSIVIALISCFAFICTSAAEPRVGYDFDSEAAGFDAAIRKDKSSPPLCIEFQHPDDGVAYCKSDGDWERFDWWTADSALSVQSIEVSSEVVNDDTYIRILVNGSPVVQWYAEVGQNLLTENIALDISTGDQISFRFGNDSYGCVRGPFRVNFCDTPIASSGALKVTILPQEAVDAGAKWRVDGGAWQDSGATCSGLSEGKHTVSYLSLAEWDAPGDDRFTVAIGNTTTISGIYAPIIQANAFAGCALDLYLTTIEYDEGRISSKDINDSACVEVGEKFMLGVVAQNVSNLDTYGIDLSFDDSRLAFIDAYEDFVLSGIYNILKKNGGSTVGFQAVEKNPGTVNIANALAGTDETEAPEGSGLMAILRFEALDEDYNNDLAVSAAAYLDSAGNTSEITNRSGARLNPVQLVVSETAQECSTALDCYIACFNSIQEAIDYPTGYITLVTILLGVYDAGVTVDKTTTLLIENGLVILRQNTAK